MKLRHSPTSPYVRKVVMVAKELGLADRIAIEPTDPWSAETTLPADNPLSKVPALATDDGLVLFDSPVICAYLDELAGGKLTPAGRGRWVAARLEALGDGICDAAILRRLEGAMRPADKRWDGWADRQKRAVDRALDALEAAAGDLAGPPTIGSLAVAAALGYLDFRFAHEDWRPGRPGLAAWFETARTRPSFAETAPPG